MQNIFSRNRRIEVKFAARPLRRHADRRVWGEPVLFRLLAEVHADRDVAAPMDMHMPVPLDFKNRKGQADIHGLVPIGAIIDPVRLD